MPLKTARHRRHCIIHFQQSVRFVAVYLRDQRRGLSDRHYGVNDSRSSRCRRIYPDSIGTRLIDGNWYVCDYVVVFLLDTRRRQMERIHRPNSVEPHQRGTSPGNSCTKMSSFFVFVSCCFWHHCQRKSSRFGRIDVSVLAQRFSLI